MKARGVEVGSEHNIISTPPDHRIVANNEILPFKDGTVDIVVASSSCPLYSESQQEVEDFFNEVVRVLKSSGQARISPVSNLHDTMREKNKYVPSSLAKYEMEKKGISLGKYNRNLKKKLNKLESYVRHVIKSLKKREDITIEIASNSKTPFVKNVLIIRKK